MLVAFLYVVWRIIICYRFGTHYSWQQQKLRECEHRGKNISVDYIIQSFNVSEEAASKRKRTLANTTYEWKSRAEREDDDIIVLKYASMINKIAPKNLYKLDFEVEYNRQIERDSWYADSRARWWCKLLVLTKRKNA